MNISFEDSIRNCRKCKNIIANCKPLIFGNIAKSKFVFISEEPTKTASENDFFQSYLGAPEKRFHSEWMFKMGITIGWLKKYPYITHVYKCYSAKKNKCKVCLNWLEQEKRYFKNKIIITFGDTALT